MVGPNVWLGAAERTDDYLRDRQLSTVGPINEAALKLTVDISFEPTVVDVAVPVSKCNEMRMSAEEILVDTVAGGEHVGHVVNELCA